MRGFYHSHAHGDPSSSETDFQIAFYPEAMLVIISLKEEVPVARAFKLRKK